MPLNARDYREEMYRLRRHPGAQRPLPEAYVDEPQAWGKLYFSALLFVMLEYVLEARIEGMISGLVFPTGFLLFWSFYYSFYRPGDLEEALSHSKRADLSRLPFLLLGTAIWLVKATLTKTMHFFGFGKSDLRRPSPRPESRRATKPGPRPSAHRRPQHQSAPTPIKPVPPPPGLPREVLNALAVLGLGPCRDWNLIHRRYRELAKKYHPDLNREITSVGQRFMTCDAAYRKLVAVKAVYFFERRERG